MSNETLFYIFGIGLTVLAVVISAIGVRSERFPGSRVLLGLGVALFAAFVVGTAAFGWMNAEDEQEHREQELAEAQKESIEEGEPGEAQEEGAETVEEETTASVDGAQVFDDQGCGGCHTLAAAGSTGTTGPVLDSSLKNDDEQFIREQIVNPNSDIERGFPPDVMPQNYEQQLSPEELDALVQFLAQSRAEG